MTNRTKAISYDYQVRFFWILVSLSLLCLGFYVYAINATARNVATRQEVERQISKISSNLSALEFTYIELKNNVTIELANVYGFKEVKNPLFISRSSASSLSFNILSR